MKDTDLARRLKKSREYLNLTQKYVAHLMGLTHSAISDIENGKRAVLTNELKMFSDIYGVNVEKLLYGDNMDIDSTAVFARTFKDLKEEDQKEILHLINFKKQLRDSLAVNA